MDKVLKVAHFVALALFLGSIPGPILLGRLADPALDLPGFLSRRRWRILPVRRYGRKTVS